MAAMEGNGARAREGARSASLGRNQCESAQRPPSGSAGIRKADIDLAAAEVREQQRLADQARDMAELASR